MRRADSRDSVYSASSCVSGVGGWQIGDRARLGDRTGRIEFIGTTQFAPGEWIGLVLDGPHGKNDGSVNGVRYFTCDPNHGLFCKSGKLERMASIDSPSRFKSPTPGNSSIGGESSVYATECGYDIGERVLVAGGKLGTVRYLGTADFAQGLWAGVELDQPYGKNDGSVQGKRYFTCKAPYGIFVSASKVQRAPNQNTPVRNDIYHHNKASILRTSRAHGGSHESLSSIGRSSMASSRFGVLKRPGIRPNIVTGNAENNQMLLSLQEAVREKDSHLEKLLAERDSMKEEMAQLHKRIQQLEKSGSASESGSPAPVDSKQFDELKQRISKLSAENDELQTQLAEKQSAIENFSFQMDEINIEKDVKIKELEGQLSALTMSSANADREATAEVETKIREITEKMQKQETEFKLNLGKSAENVAQLENELARLKEQYSVQLYELEETVQLKTHSTDEAQAQLTKAKQEIEGMKQQHAAYEEAIKTKSSSSEEATLQLAQLKAEIEKMKQQHSTFEEAIKQKDASAEELKTHLAKEKEEHEKMKEQVLHLEESVQAKIKTEHELSGELAKANEQIEELKQQHATFEEAIKAKSSSSEEAHLELAQLKAEIEKMKHNHASEVITLQGSIDEEKRLTDQAKEEIQRLKQQSAASGEELMSQLTKIKEELEKAVAERKQESEVLNQKLAASEDERKKLQEAFEQLKLQNSAEVESLRKNIESLEQTNASSESQLTKANQELQTKIGQLTEEGNGLTQKLAESNEERKKIQEILEQVKLQNAADLEKLQKSEHEFSAELTKARAEIEGLKQQHATFEEAIKAKSSSSEEAHLELAQLKAEIEKMKHNHASEVITLQGSIDEEKRLTDQAKEEIQRLKQQSAASGEELMSQLTKTKEELERAAAERKQESEALNQKLAASEEEKKTIQEAFEQIKLQNSAQIEKMTSEGDNLKRDSETLNQKLATSEEEKRKIQEAFEQVNSKNEALQKKIESLEQTNASSESQLTKTNQELQAKIEQMVVIETDLRKKSELADQSLFASEEERKRLLENLEQVKLQNSAEVESLQEKVVSLEQANASSESQLAKTNQELQAKIQQIIEERNGLNQKLVANDEEKRNLEGTIEQMKRQISSLEDSLKMSGATSEQANNHLLELRAEIEKTTLEGNRLRQESEALNQKLAVSEEEKRTVQETLEQTKLQNSSEVESLQKKVVSLEQANASSESQLAKTNQELQAKIERMVQEGNDLGLKLAASEEEKMHLQGTIEQMKIQSSSEMESLIQKMTTLEMSNASADSQVSEKNQELQAKVEKMESESKDLKQKLDLYMEIEEQTRRKNVHLSEKIGDLELQIDALTSQNKDEQTVAFVQQIDFLNSIIASQQKKDEKRKAKVEELKSQIAEMQANGGDPVVGRKSVAKLLEKKDMPPRTYCDICELFDQHETQDCPQQALQAAEFAAHSHHHSPEKDGKKTKPPPREYCDNCEEFGHDTEKCPKKSKKKEYTF